MANDEGTETTADTGESSDDRPKPEFEGQEVLAGDGETEDVQNKDDT